MSPKFMKLAFAFCVATTLLNVVVFVGQFSPASARGATTSASKLLDNDDFVEGLTKIIRKTVRNYCTVGKKEGIDC
jgi:hypothetical protein